ncbi:hypothetical protein LJC04_00345 [Ruminococcaceae bacterium OttesenSCG-928-O06]|nr:hypothetical protein [Ruminococcaceae bacterium OttesenSCG-928-O06]
MTSKKRIHYINELQEIQRLAVESPYDVGLHAEDGSVIIDAKSYIGMYALDFSKPVLVVSEDEALHRKIHDIGENVK